MHKQLIYIFSIREIIIVEANLALKSGLDLSKSLNACVQSMVMLRLRNGNRIVVTSEGMLMLRNDVHVKKEGKNYGKTGGLVTIFA